MWNGQTTPLMVAASLVPALGFLLAVKPNISVSLWIARPSMGIYVAGSWIAAAVAANWVPPSPVLPSGQPGL
jgi:hypothetical protein